MIYRIILHITCALRKPRNARWHMAGITNEFRKPTADA